MKLKQIDIFGNETEVRATKPKAVDNVRRKWESGFQRWSNKQLFDGTTPNGKCGYGAMCDYCEDNTYGRPCVRALNAMCREKNIKIDYTKYNYQDIWEGDYGKV